MMILLKELICIMHTARCYIKIIKKVKINNNNCFIRMETFDDDKREHSTSLASNIPDKLMVDGWVNKLSDHK